MPRIYIARDAADAHVVVAYLASHGIATRVEGESLAMAAGSVPVGPLTGPAVHVDDDAVVERALALLSARPTGEPEPTHCPACGYDLTGLPLPRCPECGTPFPRPVPSDAPPWKCPTCGEEIEGQFTECWNCVPNPESDELAPLASCPACGSDITGLTDSTCPECGTMLPAPP
jgi:predicted amidophosphoribosyltransferase